MGAFANVFFAEKSNISGIANREDSILIANLKTDFIEMALIKAAEEPHHLLPL